MTVTEDTLEQESTTADPLDDVIGGLEAILGQLRQARSHGGSSLMLRFRAAGVRKAAGGLEVLQDALAREALECDGEAAAIVAAEEAKEVLEQAAAAVEAAQAGYDATAEPELEAGRKAITARQRAEDAGKAFTQAQQDGVEPDHRDELAERLQRRQEGLEFYGGELVKAQQARQMAGEALERARAAHRQALADLAAAEEAAAHPGPASLSPGDLAKAYMFDFPRRAFDGEEKTPEEWAAIKWNASKTCDALKVIPPGAEALVTEQVGRRIAEATRGGGTVQVELGGHVITLARVPSAPSGSTILATSAQAR